MIKGDFERRRLEKMQLGIYSLLMGVVVFQLSRIIPDYCFSIFDRYCFDIALKD